MDFEFGDNYVVLVLLLLWGLCFCRNLLESVSSCARLLESCAARDMCCGACARVCVCVPVRAAVRR